jgi:hypothetical protein
LGIGTTIIHHVHTSGVIQRVKKFTIKVGCFPQAKLMMGVLSLAFEPSKNKPCIVEWREYL